MFDFMAHVDKKARKQVHMEQLVTREMEHKQASKSNASESSASKLCAPELDTEDLVSEGVGQVCHREPLMH